LISDSKAFKKKFSVKPDAAGDASLSRHLSTSTRSAIQAWNANSKPCSPFAKAHHSLEKEGLLYKPCTTPHHKDKEPPHPSGTLSAFNTDNHDQKNSVNAAHCYIAFHNDITLSWSAGRIREILTHESQTLLVVDPFRALSPADMHYDHYCRYPTAGGRIFYDAPEPCPIIISPTQLIGHVALVQNVSTDIAVPHCLIIPLDRVS
jgi:hypothetical protein